MTNTQPFFKNTTVHLLAFFALLLGSQATAQDFSAVRALLKDAVSQQQVAGGTVLVLHRGEVVFEESFGFADILSKTPFKADTPVIVASISKPLLGTAAFRLAEQGKLDHSAAISDYLPEFSSVKLESGEVITRAPTLTELFTHTSGMRNSEAPGGRPWFAKWTEGTPLADVVKRYASEFPFQANPGKRYAYSGIGTDVAARVLEVASGQPRNVLLVAHVAKPLGMTSTFYRDARSLKQIGRMPTRYFHGKKGKLLKSTLRPVPPTNTYSSSGGSIISTAPDLARWLMMIRNQGQHEDEAFLKPETITAMLHEFPLSKNAQGGLFIREKDATGRAIVVGHSGSSGTNCWINFKQDVIGIMLTQTRGSDIKQFRIELEKRVTECFDD
ncbi:MAG: hypothetical protein COA78_34405 [Blastopirellula sp.]|nr:MAG: hypothetical protein COA78_34405 [Blastopirellula sp.]